VEPIAHVMNVVLQDLGRVGKGEVDTVSGIENLVAFDAIITAVPDMDAVATILLDEIESSLDPIPGDHRTVAAFDVDPVQGLVDPIVFDGHAVGLHQDACHVLHELCPGFADLETANHGSVSLYVDDTSLVATL